MVWWWWVGAGEDDFLVDDASLQYRFDWIGLGVILDILPFLYNIHSVLFLLSSFILLSAAWLK